MSKTEQNQDVESENGEGLSESAATESESTESESTESESTESESTEAEENSVETEGEDVTVESLQAQLAEAEEKSADNLDQLMRSRAEMENVRRRSERELANAHKYALDKFAQELLPVIDSMEMGVAAAKDDNADIDKLREGIELTLTMFETAIEKFGIKGVHPKGEIFNPEHHQAMTMIDSPDHEPNTIIDVMQKGYLLNERLVRPAMVVVASNKSGGEENKSGKVDEET